MVTERAISTFYETIKYQIPMTEILISKQCLVLEGFGHWIFEFEFYLKFGAWNLYFLEHYSNLGLNLSL